MKKGTLRRLDSLATDGVERTEPNGPPIAFRIWKAGLNVTDHGPTVFSERSAELLAAEQATRGNRYSIDVDHLSLNKDAPIENHAAVGWHSLEVRNGELWAVAVEWSDVVRDGLTKDPPAWKYFSPAYDVDPDTGEVVSYLNTALTNNPATHRVTALATREARSKRMATKAKKMSWGDIKAALDGDDENAKAAAYAAIQAAFPDGDEKQDAEGEPDGDEPEKKDAEDEPKKDAEDEPEKKDAEDEPEKKDAIAAALAEVNRLASRVRELEKDKAESERKRLIASRPDFAPELVKILEKAPLAMVREHVEKLPKAAVKPISTEGVQATRGAAQGSGEASALPPSEKDELDRRMGLKKTEGAVKHEGVHQVFATVTPSQARRLAAKGGK